MAHRYEMRSLSMFYLLSMVAVSHKSMTDFIRSIVVHCAWHRAGFQVMVVHGPDPSSHYHG